MDDLISRQATIKALWKINDERDSVYYTSAIHNAVDVVEALPSAERLGRWIEKRNVAFPHLLCSECKKPFYGSRFDVWNYCPNCGARMEATE